MISRAWPVAVKPAFPVEGEFLTTVRDFGGSRLIGLLPREARTVKLPPAAGVRYDLLRGGIAAETVEASSEKPVLLVERAVRIAKRRAFAAGVKASFIVGDVTKMDPVEESFDLALDLDALAFSAAAGDMAPVP